MEVLKIVPKETLDLNELESALKSNPMIKTAEVYVTVNGTLKAEIEQKTPIARVSTNASYYIDDDGNLHAIVKQFLRLEFLWLRVMLKKII